MLHWINQPWQRKLEPSAFGKTAAVQTKARSLQSNGMSERFHKAQRDERNRVAFRKKVSRSIEELRADLDELIRWHNEGGGYAICWCFRKTPMQAFLGRKAQARDKQSRAMAA